MSAHQNVPSQKRENRTRDTGPRVYGFGGSNRPNNVMKERPRIHKRLITIEYVWFPAVQTLIGTAGRQRGDALKPVGKVSLLQSMA